MRASIFLEAYGKTWSMCFVFLLFFASVAMLARRLRLPQFDCDIPAKRSAWLCAVPGFLLLALCLTLIDKPKFPMTDVTAEWLFMFSAFLGIPAALPLITGGIWALAHHMQELPLRLSSLALLMLGTFALGCAASNLHDLAWCGAITDGYTKHFAAGYDLDYFVACGQYFGIPRETLGDYATLGPFAAVLVLGELLVAAAAFARLLSEE